MVKKAAPALPHGTPNQKGVTFTAVPNPFDRPIKNDPLEVFNIATQPTCLLQLQQRVRYIQLRNPFS